MPSDSAMGAECLVLFLSIRFGLSRTRGNTQFQHINHVYADWFNNQNICYHWVVESLQKVFTMTVYSYEVMSVWMTSWFHDILVWMAQWYRGRKMRFTVASKFRVTAYSTWYLHNERLISDDGKYTTNTPFYDHGKNHANRISLNYNNYAVFFKVYFRQPRPRYIGVSNRRIYYKQTTGKK